MAKDNDPDNMSFEDFLNSTNHPAAQEPNHKVIPPTKSKVADDALAEAFMAHGILALFIMALGGANGKSEEANEQMQDLALEAAARFRGRVVAGEISL